MVAMQRKVIHPCVVELRYILLQLAITTSNVILLVCYYLTIKLYRVVMADGDVVRLRRIHHDMHGILSGEVKSSFRRRVLSVCSKLSAVIEAAKDDDERNNCLNQLYAIAIDSKQYSWAVLDRASRSTASVQNGIEHQGSAFEACRSEVDKAAIKAKKQRVAASVLSSVASVAADGAMATSASIGSDSRSGVSGAGGGVVVQLREVERRQDAEDSNSEYAMGQASAISTSNRAELATAAVNALLQDENGPFIDPAAHKRSYSD